MTWAGADPRVGVNKRESLLFFFFLKWEPPGSLYRHPIIPEKAGSPGFIVRCLLHQ